MAAKKKRGVKPGVKRGPYRKNKIIRTRIPNAEWRKLLDSAATIPSSVGNLPSLISDLASTIDNLEAQLTAQIDRIKSILR